MFKHGMELEFTAAVAHAHHPRLGGFYDYLLTLMRESGIHDWRYEVDASCGNEVVSPILQGEKGLTSALQVCHCAVMAQKTFGLGRLLGPDAGVHYHFDATDLVKQGKQNVMVIRNVLLLSTILEPLWFSMNPGSRFETAFAAPLNFNLFQLIRARDMVDIRDLWFRSYMGVKGHRDSYRVQRNSYSPDFVNSERTPDKYDWTRYHGMNLVALWKHGTFEFRYTHGSFEPENIENWFRFYKSVVDLASVGKTRPLVRACPMNIDGIKSNSVMGLHDMIYADLNLAINFMFKSSGKAQPLFAPNAKMLKFILHKIIKYNPDCMPGLVMKKVWKDDGTNFDRLMGYIKDIRISSVHARRNRYKFTPPSNHVTPYHNPDNLDEDFPAEEYQEDEYE